LWHDTFNMGIHGTTINKYTQVAFYTILSLANSIIVMAQ